VRSAENADPVDTSGFDRFAAQGTALSALITFAGWWKKPSPPWGNEPREKANSPISAPLPDSASDDFGYADAMACPICESEHN
jgi:hypothetical protein